MTNINKPYIIIISGPNGAGKTTFYNQIISQNPFFLNTVFINYDNEIATLKELPEYALKYQQLLSRKQQIASGLKIIPNANIQITSVPYIHAYPINEFISYTSQLSNLNLVVARNASKRLRKKIHDAFTNSKNIIFETTSPAQRMRSSAEHYGYDIYGFHICVSEPELSVARVQHRVKNGGHDIPQPVIFQRYQDNISMLSKSIITETAAIVIDNSNKKPFTPIFALSKQHIINIAECPDYLQKTYNKLSKKLPHESLTQLLNLQPDLDIKGLPSDQRKTLLQIMLLHLMGKITGQHHK